MLARARVVLAILTALSSASAIALPSDALVSLRVSHDNVLERGKTSVISVVVSPASGYTLMEDGPLVLDITGSQADPIKRSLRRTDAVDPRAQMPRFELSVRPYKEGMPQLNVELTAWVCQAQRCRPTTVHVQVPLPTRDQPIP
jgi:hypothetical protein